MKNIFTYIFLIFIFSCSSTKLEKKLIGKWYSSSKNRIETEFDFYKDSLVIYNNFGKSTLKWKVESKNIYTSYTNKSGPIFKIYNYKSNKDSESLNIEIIANNSAPLELTKAKNAFDFFQKLIGLEIQLPTKETKLEQIGFPNNLNFNIYAGYNDNILVVKTDLASDLNNLEKDVNKFKENSRDELKRHLRFNLIADKNITDSQMDSIKDLLKTTSIERIFRTYKSKQADYENSLNWFGEKE